MPIGEAPDGDWVGVGGWRAESDPRIDGSTLLAVRRIDERLDAIEYTLAAAGHPVAASSASTSSQIGELRADIAALSKKIDDLASGRKKNKKKHTK
jgi:hypothetical protein